MQQCKSDHLGTPPNKGHPWIRLRTRLAEMLVDLGGQKYLGRIVYFASAKLLQYCFPSLKSAVLFVWAVR